jgi:hypothetical protein
LVLVEMLVFQQTPERAHLVAELVVLVLLEFSQQPVVAVVLGPVETMQETVPAVQDNNQLEMLARL